MTEFELIYRYFEQQLSGTSEIDSLTGARVIKSLGDDAAIIAIDTNSQLVSCVDTLVQGRHFSEDWQQVEALAFAIGYKSVAVNVSDLAAMGAIPHHILLALSLPERLANEQWLSEFAKGLFHACSQFGIQLIGGDTTRHDKLIISITAQGVMAKQTSPIYRNGAQVGDKVYVSGTLGDACYALHHLKDNTDEGLGQQLAHRLHMPTPRIQLGQALAAQGKATAMVDVSDGLVQDLHHICQQSGVSVRLKLESLPTSDALQQADLIERLLCQLTGGDDYELLFTLPANVAPPSSHTSVSCIGEVINKAESESKPLPLVELSYQGHTITTDHPAPFTELPNLHGFQHFS